MKKVEEILRSTKHISIEGRCIQWIGRVRGMNFRGAKPSRVMKRGIKVDIVSYRLRKGLEEIFMGVKRVSRVRFSLSSKETIKGNDSRQKSKDLGVKFMDERARGRDREWNRLT